MTSVAPVRLAPRKASSPLEPGFAPGFFSPWFVRWTYRLCNRLDDGFGPVRERRAPPPVDLLLHTGNIRCYRMVPEWKNSGTTPAKSLVANMDSTEHVGDLPADFPYGYSSMGTKIFLGPQANAGSKAIDLRAGSVRQVAGGQYQNLSLGAG